MFEKSGKINFKLIKKSKHLNTIDFLKSHMTQIKINYTYEVLLLLLKKEMHQRELSKQLNTSLTRIQSVLKDLQETNVVDYKKIGKNHIYFIKKNLVSKTSLLNAENYKLIKLLRKHPSLETIFIKIIEKCNNETIILFGSYAKGKEKKGSDIDIYINTTNQKLKQEIQNIYEPLSIKIGKFNPNDLLIKEIIKNHIIIKGGEKYYQNIQFLE
jgi:predicted nucleotidyltransferase/Trp operon repressor